MIIDTPPSQVFLFGDQTNGFESDLQTLLHDGENELLQSFFEKAYRALRREIAQLSALRRDQFPRFTSLLDLLQHCKKEKRIIAIDMCLLTLTHLGRFIKYFGEGSRSYPRAADSRVLGMCTGALAAAAVSTSQTIFELVPAAVEAVLVSFRVGIVSLQTCDDIVSGDVEGSWSAVVHVGIGQAVAALESFSEDKAGCPIVSLPYISAVLHGSVTISGPPAVLTEFLQTRLGHVRTLRLPVFSPYHAAHIYSPDVIDSILAASNSQILLSYGSRIPLVSCSDGKQVPKGTFASLLRMALEDILIETFRWDNVLVQCQAELTQAAETKAAFHIFPILTTAAPSLAAALTSKSHPLQSPLDAPSAQAAVRDVTAGKERDSSASEKAVQSKIAIVAYSGRFPNAASNEKFWELIHSGLDVHREIPADRFDWKAHYDPTGKTKNTSRVKMGCFIDEPGLFDARFFNMSPRECAQADPGQRLAITTAYEAMEMAGFVPNRTPSSQKDRIGIFYGMTSDDWREVNSGQNVDTYFIPGGNRAFTPGRINYHFKLSGPSFSVDTACSSSFAAIHIACNSLWRGDCDTAIAGGTNVMTNPDNFAGLERGHFLSTTGNCNTFDDGADGYCRADAVGTVILKRLDDAIADHDPIQGVIVGAYTNHSAEADSMTRPHVGAQAFIFNKMLGQANIDPLDVSYIEMHGTGTQTGDAVEMKSVLEVFAKHPRGAKHPLHLGSVKSNIGHAESASGVSSLIKVLKMMEKSEIPPHCGIKTKINHGFPTDLKERNVNIPFKATSWQRPTSGKRIAFLNNFSAAGGNTALLLEDAPIQEVLSLPKDVRSSHVVAISAKTPASLEKNIQAMIRHLSETPSTFLPALSYTTTARRMHHNHRIIVDGADITSIKNALSGALGTCKDVRPINAAKVPNVAFAFSGQGALYNGTGKAFYESIASFRGDIQRFDRISQSQGFPSILPLVEGHAANISTLSPVIAQLGAVCVQMALTNLCVSWGITPSVVIGHSLGEYAALHAAGVLSASDVIFLAGSRAQLLLEHCQIGTHSMLSVGAAASKVREHLADSRCEIACTNGPEDTVIAGPLASIQVLKATLISSGLKAVQLDVPFAFHSAQVDPILSRFEALASHVTFSRPKVPYISPLLKEVVTEAGVLNGGYLSQACRNSVNFMEGVNAALAANAASEKTVWIDVGAHPICLRLIKSIISSQVRTVPLLHKNDDAWKVISKSLSSLHTAGIDIQWDEYHRDFPASHTVLRLPEYAWDLKNYWIQYENNFCLTKGDAPAAALVDKECKEPVPTLSTTSVQKVLAEDHGDLISTLLIESDLADPKLSQSATNHKVNGVALCTSSLWADVALTMATYLADRKGGLKGAGFDVAEMKADKSLIYHAQGPQVFRASATADWALQTVKFELYSVDSQGKRTTGHAVCTVYIGDKEEWKRGWKRNAYLIQSRIDALQRSLSDTSNPSQKLHRGMAYRLFGGVVEYGRPYQGMEDVVLNSDMYEATARVRFQPAKDVGSFELGPYQIESLGHIAGFVMNANERTDPNTTVYINHGWERMRCAATFSADKTYQTYNKMQEGARGRFSGDTYILDDGEIVAVFEGIVFQELPRKTLNVVLPKPLENRARTSGPVTSVVSNKTATAAVSVAKNSPVKSISMKSSQIAVSNNLVAPAPPAPRFTSVDKVLAIIADEVGLKVSELQPSTEFVDFGVDSLLSLNITSRLREELNMDLGSSLFIDYPTVSELAAFLGAGSTGVTTVAQSDTGSSVVSALDALKAGSASDESSDTSVDGLDNPDEGNVLSIIRLIVSEELGIPTDELKDTTSFSDYGLDSLLSLTILGRLKEVLDIEIPSDVFSANDTLDEVRTSLNLAPRPVGVSAPIVKEVPVQAVTHPRATSVLLQGNPKKASKNFFLFPDGSGSAVSYSRLPAVSPDVAIYGLNCPYMRTPQNMKCALQDLTASYIAEVRQRQPHGPYYFGGWSAGGICAFDAAQQLDREGEKVERLVLIDTPNPIGIEKLPPRLYDFFKSIDLFGGPDSGPPPDWLLPHFLAFIDGLDLYRPVPYATANAPRTHIIWARDGVCKFPDSPRPSMEGAPREMKWLLNNRTDFGPNGWDRLVGQHRLVIDTMSGVNHFTMMEGGKAAEVAALIKKAMA